MDCDVLEESNENEKEKTYTEIFYEVFPFYLSIGMSYEQFWNEDVDLVKYYRKANDLKFEQKNYELWLQGMYIYDAVSAVVYNVWCRKKNEQAISYTAKPYDFNVKKNKEEYENEQSAKAEVWMKNLVNMYK